MCPYECFNIWYKSDNESKNEKLYLPNNHITYFSTE